MLFDGAVGEEAWPDDGSVGPPLMTLGVEEIDLLQKVQEMIRANPGKAESLFEKFIEILKEENKEDLMCNHCPPVLNDRDGWDGNQMRVSLPPSPDSGSVKTIQKRGAGLRRKVAKKKQASKGKKVAKRKDRGNMKSRKAEKKQTGVESPNKTRKLSKKEKQKEKKMKTKKRKQKKKTNKKMKKILKMKKTKQQRKVNQGERQRTKYLEKMEELNTCTSLWAKLTNVGLGVASALQKQVTDIDLDIKVISLAGKYHIEE